MYFLVYVSSATTLFDRSELVHRIADNVHNTAESRLSNRHHDRASKVDDLHTAYHTVGRQHRNRTNPALAKVLLDLRHDVNRRFDIKTVRNDSQRLVDRRKIVFEFDVDNRANNTCNTAGSTGRCGYVFGSSGSHLSHFTQ